MLDLHKEKKKNYQYYCCFFYTSFWFLDPLIKTKSKKIILISFSKNNNNSPKQSSYRTETKIHSAPPIYYSHLPQKSYKKNLPHTCLKKKKARPLISITPTSGMRALLVRSPRPRSRGPATTTS